MRMVASNDASARGRDDSPSGRRSCKFRSLAAITSALAAIVLPTHALAQDASLRADADRLFEEARRLQAQGDWPQACAKFQESYDRLPRHGVQLNLAVCSEQLGNRVTAFLQFEEALVAAQADGRDDRTQLAREHLNSLRTQLGHCSLEWSDAQAPQGVELHLDGHRLEPPVRSSLPLEPGTHVLSVTAPERERLNLHITIKAGELIRLVIPVLKKRHSERTASASRRPIVTRPSSPPPRTAGHATLGYTAVGVGLAATGVGAFFGMRALTDGQDLHETCPHLACTSDNALAAGRRLERRAQTSADLANVFLPIGLVTIAGGLFVLLSGPAKGVKPKSPAVLSARMTLVAPPRLVAMELSSVW